MLFFASFEADFSLFLCTCPFNYRFLMFLPAHAKPFLTKNSHVQNFLDIVVFARLAAPHPAPYPTKLFVTYLAVQILILILNVLFKSDSHFNAVFFNKSQTATFWKPEFVSDACQWGNRGRLSAAGIGQGPSDAVPTPGAWSATTFQSRTGRSTGGRRWGAPAG